MSGRIGRLARDYLTGGVVTRRLIGAVMLFSILLALATTGVQAVLDYRAAVERVRTSFDIIRDSHLESLTHNVWVANRDQIELQLKGLLALRGIETVAIHDAGEAKWQAGGRHSEEVLQRDFTLTYRYRDKAIDLGTLRVTAGLDPVRARIVGDAAGALVVNAIEILLVALFLVVTVKALIMRHLERIAEFTARLDLGRPYEPLTLDRRPPRGGGRDELAQVVSAINGMATGLKQSYDTLEQRVETRTRDLARAVADLEREVASRKKAEEQLQKSNAELEEFAYVASHDLKAPLRGIRNLAGWIEDDLQGRLDDETTENLELLKSRVDRMGMLLDGLLDYSRAGRVEHARETVDVAALLGDVADFLAPPAGFTIAADGPLPVFETERIPFETVLRNLIGNAVKHHDRDTGRVGVACRDAGDVYEFSVADDGPGIPAEYRERIFMMFQTLKPRDEVEGSGMGLALVKKIVEHHGGTVQVDSAPEERGTVFRFGWRKDGGQLLEHAVDDDR